MRGAKAGVSPPRRRPPCTSSTIALVVQNVLGYKVDPNRLESGGCPIRGELSKTTIEMTDLLRFVGAVEVVPGDAALGAGHVPADDEVRAPEVLADQHVLHRLFTARDGRQNAQNASEHTSPTACVLWHSSTSIKESLGAHGTADIMRKASGQTPSAAYVLWHPSSSTQESLGISVRCDVPSSEQKNKSMDQDIVGSGSGVGWPPVLRATKKRVGARTINSASTR